MNRFSRASLCIGLLVSLSPLAFGQSSVEPEVSKSSSFPVYFVFCVLIPWTCIALLAVHYLFASSGGVPRSVRKLLRPILFISLFGGAIAANQLDQWPFDTEYRAAPGTPRPIAVRQSFGESVLKFATFVVFIPLGPWMLAEWLSGKKMNPEDDEQILTEAEEENAGNTTAVGDVTPAKRPGTPRKQPRKPTKKKVTDSPD